MAFDGIPQVYAPRTADVKRTARELSQVESWRAEFLRAHAGPSASLRQKIDAHAVIDPNLSDAEYRLLRFREYWLNDLCDNYFVSTKREAATLAKSPAAIERASKGLEGKYQTSTRRSNDSSWRVFSVPEVQLELAEDLVFLLEMQGATRKSDVCPRNRQPANLQKATRKYEGLTLVLNSKEERGGAANSLLSIRGAGKLPGKLISELAGKFTYEVCA